MVQKEERSISSPVEVVDGDQIKISECLISIKYNSGEQD